MVYFANTNAIANKLILWLDKEGSFVDSGNLLRLAEHIANSDKGLEQ